MMPTMLEALEKAQAEVARRREICPISSTLETLIYDTLLKDFFTDVFQRILQSGSDVPACECAYRFFCEAGVVHPLPALPCRPTKLPSEL